MRRIYWNFYQLGMWEYFAQNNLGIRHSIVNLGDPFEKAVELTHDLGMEFYATIKPYETGGSHTYPHDYQSGKNGITLPSIAGNYVVDRWVRDRHEFRLKCRSADLICRPSDRRIGRIQLRQKDDSPVRIEAENIQIWTSQNNNGYQLKDVEFSVDHSTTVSAEDVFDMEGILLTRKGDHCSVIDIRGLNLQAPFIAITTDFDDGDGTFSNTAFEMLRVSDLDGEQLPIIIGSHKALWRPHRNFRVGDLEYDNGLGNEIVHLDVSNTRAITKSSSSGKDLTMDGIIAFSVGRQEFLSGSLCEGYPDVREYWMSWLKTCVESGVDGVDVRISNHSGWTNTPEIYGFNEPVKAEYVKLYGDDPDTSDFNSLKIGQIRGEFFDLFLTDARQLLRESGKKLSVNLEAESFRTDACQSRWRTRPGNITFNWSKWLNNSMTDEATLLCRGWDINKVLNDEVASKMLEDANSMGIPVHLSKQVGHGKSMTESEKLAYAHADTRLSGFCYYETASMIDSTQPMSDNGLLNFKQGLIENIKTQVDSLGINQ